MQTKLFEQIERAGLNIGTRSPITVTNAEDRKANFHNMHWSGRVIGDATGSNGFSSGYLVLFCIMQQQLTPPTTISSAVLDDFQGNIILAKQWFTFSGATYTGGADFFDWDFDLGKVSRTCPKEGRIIANVYNDTGSVKNATVTHDFSYNITQA